MMTDKPKKLSDTARALLTAAAMRNDHLVPLPKLPVAAVRQVVRSLLNAGFAEEVRAPTNDPGYAWRIGENVGGVIMLRATRFGMERVAADGSSEAVLTKTSPEKADNEASGVAIAAT
jgi:hypothetical protein